MTIRIAFFSIFTSMQSEKTGLLILLLSAYIISTGFTYVLVLPVVGEKIQIPELVFIPLFFTWTFIFRRGLFTLIKPDRLQWSILVYLFVVTLSAIHSGQVKGILELAGLVYLLLVFIIFKTSIPFIPNPSARITKLFLVCGLIAAALGIIGWLLFQFGIENTLVKFETQFPYFGQIARATGLTATPNMLFNLIGICFLIYFSYFLSLAQKRIQHYLGLFVMLSALVLTFSKTFLLLLVGILVLYQHHFIKNKIGKLAAISTSIFLFMICMIGSHFIFIHQSTQKSHQNIYKGYYENKPIASIGAYEAFPTNYTVLKETSIIAGTENLLGVCPGGNNEFLQKLKSERRYPDYFENFDPHSTYFGTFGETGIFGLIALLWMMYEIARQLLHIQKTNSYLAGGLLACFIFFSLEGIVLDILNFRHLWILLGATAFMFKSSTFESR